MSATLSELPTLEPLADGTGFRTRVRFRQERRRFRIATTDESLALKRATVLAELGAQLGPPTPPELARDLLERAGAADGPELARIRLAVAKLASGGVRVKAKSTNPRASWTVRELGEAWTDGTLAKEYPD